MTDRPEHLIDPSDIPVGSRVRFDCSVPSCTFHFWHVWLSSDGRAFGDSNCYMHGNNPVMVITEVTPPIQEGNDVPQA